MSPRLLILAFLSGAVLAGAGVNALYVHVRPLQRESLRLVFAASEGRAADADYAQGKLLESLVHRWSALNAHASRPPWPYRSENPQRDSNFWLPITLLWQRGSIERLAAPQDNWFQRILLAETLDRFGWSERAEEEWARAVEVAGSNQAYLRELARGYLDSRRPSGTQGREGDERGAN